MNKNIVCYFSATNTTKKVALKISEILKCDSYSIDPVIPYSDADLDWTNDESRSSVEMKEDIKPAIVTDNFNLDEYDTVILGFPVWWYKEPTIIDEFIEKNDFTNKKVYVFVTSGSSTVDGSLDNLKKKYSNINFASGMRLNTLVSDSTILDWIK